MFQYVDDDPVRIGKKLPDGYYACLEHDGTIIIRNLKREAEEWGDDMSKCWSTSSQNLYPYNIGFNMNYMEIHYTCDYEYEGCHIKNDDIVVDIGANIGIFTRFALQRGAKKVYAFEPSGALFKCLSLNVDADLVELYKACVGSYTGLTRIASSSVTYPMVGMADKLLPENKYPYQDVTQCYSLDDLFDCELFPDKVDFLKVDVEGGEIEVLKGLSDKNIGRVDRMAIETHHNPQKSSWLWKSNELDALQQRLKSAFTYHNRIRFGWGDPNRSWDETLTLWRENA